MVRTLDEQALTDDVEFALQLVALAAEIARPFFESGVAAESKADGTPVTVADLTVERELIQALRHERPDDAILSEEAGPSGRSNRRWLIDPIDGTEMFVAGDASWGTHLALEVDGDIVLGVMSRPVLRQRWWAARGRGAHRCGETGASLGVVLQVSDVADLAGSQVSVWSEGPSLVAEHLASLTRLVEPAYDDYIDVIEGRLEALIFPHPGIAFAWDYAPSVILISEAGGHFRDPEGGTRIDTGRGVFTNGMVDAELDAAISWHLTDEHDHDGD